MGDDFFFALIGVCGAFPCEQVAFAIEQTGGSGVSPEQKQGAEFDPIVDRNANRPWVGVFRINELQSGATEIWGVRNGAENSEVPPKNALWVAIAVTFRCWPADA